MSKRSDRAWVISQYFSPEPGFITEDVAALLAAKKRTTVVTALPNYPLGKIYDGFPKWRPQRTQHSNCTVWRLPIVPDHSTSIGRRSVSYGSFLAATALWSSALVASQGAPGLVWTYQTPFTSALPSIWLKKMFGTRLVYTVADLWPESFVAAGVAKDSRFIAALFKLRRLINRHADAIICSTQGTLEQIAADGVDRSRLHYVPVWVEGARVDDLTRTRQRRIVYAGNIGPAQQLDTVVQGAAILRERGVDITFDFYGDGVARSELEQAARSRGCDNVHFHGRVPAAHVYEKSATALGQIVCLRSDALFRMTIPSKLPFAFSVGTPVLYGLTGEAGVLAGECGGGIEFSADDPTSFAEAVQRLLGLTLRELDLMSQRMRAYYSSHFARAALLERYAAIFGINDHTVGRGAHAPPPVTSSCLADI